MAKTPTTKTVATLTHDEAKRRNIPTAEYQSVLDKEQADPVRVRLLLRNLIDNALRHSAGAAQPPSLELARDADGQLRISVRDHGPGVDDEQLARLAEPFYRADTARQRSTGGVGLGLYLCRLVAQAHGGTLAFRLAQPGLEVSARWPIVPAR